MNSFDNEVAFARTYLKQKAQEGYIEKESDIDLLTDHEAVALANHILEREKVTDQPN